jgi:hypothetical protein
MGEDSLIVRYRHESLWDLFSSFPGKEHISFASFLKYLPKNIKKPMRKTDVCGYCIRLHTINGVVERLSQKLAVCCSDSKEGIYIVYYFSQPL